MSLKGRVFPESTLVLDEFQNARFLKSEPSAYVVEGVVTPEQYPEIDPAHVICDTMGGEDSTLVVRLSSYDESAEHPIIEYLRGKKVRITVEVLD